MALNVLAPINVSAEYMTKKFYKYDSYIIEYQIIKSWKNNQNINITVTNTGSEAIVGWALEYNAGGEINGLWNAVVYNCVDNKYIIKNSGYNYAIEPNDSVTFGYTLTCKDFNIPHEIKICSQWVQKETGYKVELIKTNEWETGFQGEISISNLTNKSIEAWTLMFDSNFIIEEIWGARLISYKGNTYEVANPHWATPIQPYSTVNLGIRGCKDEHIQPAIENFILNEVIIDGHNETDLPNISDDSYNGIYCKEIINESEIVYNTDGLPYVKNQILVMVDDSVSFQQMSDIAYDMNAEIVGYIDIVNKYQIEFKSDVNLEYLQNIIDELYDKLPIEYVSLNYFFNTQVSLLPNDPLLNLDYGLQYNNWNLYAINAFRAWDYYCDMTSVNIGIIDLMFDEQHIDLKFEEIWKNPIKNNNVPNISVEKQNHGTQVAGIMASNFNNGKEIAGICPKNKLFGCCVGNGFAQMDEEVAINKLVKKDVKVINISLTTLDKLYVSSIRNGRIKQELKNEIEKSTQSLNATLKKLLKKDYDFTIVVAAGNYNIDARYGNNLNNIDDIDVNNHIIVVNAIGNMSNSNYEIWYQTDDLASNWGDKVDIAAPGVNICTIIPSFATNQNEIERYVSGTSAAAPHVSGIAGMMYSVNPDITGTEVKAIIKGTSKLRTVSDNHGFEYGIADAKLAVSTAYYYDKSEKIVFGKLEDSNDLSKIYADTDLIISYIQDGIDKSQKIRSDENGEFEFVIPKNINELELKMKADGYEIIETKRLGVFWGSSSVINVKLTPIEITVKGKVEEYNRTTKVTKPVANHTVVIYSEEQPDSVIAKGITNADGEYEIKFNKQGDFVVLFSEKKQNKFYAYNGKYIFDALFETEDVEDKDDESNIKNDNWVKGDITDNEIDDTSNEIDDINIEFGGNDDTSYTGDYSGNLFSGIWLRTYDGINNYYVHIYTTDNKGEYTSDFGAPGWGICTTLYHYWTHELKMATYKYDGTLIQDQTIDYFYKKIHVYLPYGYRPSDLTDYYPLMQTDAITSAVIGNDSITYNIHTDGYYKRTVNFIGSLGIIKEDWTEDTTKNIAFYNNSKCTGASSQKPF